MLTFSLWPVSRLVNIVLIIDIVAQCHVYTVEPPNNGHLSFFRGLNYHCMLIVGIEMSINFGPGSVLVGK